MTKLIVDTVKFLRVSRRLNDIELGAMMRALIDSAIDEGRSKNILEASYFGTKTNGFFRITPKDSISASNCSFAEMADDED